MAGIDAYAVFTGTSTVAAGPQLINQSQSSTSSYNYINLNEGTDAFGNVLPNPDIGMGKPVFVNIVITTAATGTTGATCTFAVQAGPDAGGTGTSQTGVCSSWTTLETTAAIPLAELVLGWHTSILVPPYMDVGPDATTGSKMQYLRVNQTSAGGQNFTAGAWEAWLSPEPVSTV